MSAVWTAHPVNSRDAVSYIGLCMMCTACTVDDIECQTSAGACSKTSTTRRRSHSAAELDCVGHHRRTTILSCSVSLVPDNCPHTPTDVTSTSSNSCKSDDALDLQSVTRLRHSQHL